MAPEQQKKDGAVWENTDHRADIYSLGCLAYEMLTGRFPGEDLKPPGVSRAVDEVLGRAMDPSPDKRFQRANEFASALRQAQLPSSDWWPGWALVAGFVVMGLFVSAYFFFKGAVEESVSPEASAVDSGPLYWEMERIEARQSALLERLAEAPRPLGHQREERWRSILQGFGMGEPSISSGHLEAMLPEPL